MTHFKLDDDDEGNSKIWRKKEDGGWEEVESEPVSNDPDVNSIGDLDYDEVQEILKDEEHPKHEFAKAYMKISGERMREALAPVTRRISEQYSSMWKNIIGPNILPASEILSAGPKVTPDLGLLSAPKPIMPDVPDFEPLHNPIYDLLEEQQILNERILETNTHLAEMVKQAKQDAEEQKRVAGREHSRGSWALWAAWAAVGVTVGVGIIQIIQNA